MTTEPGSDELLAAAGATSIDAGPHAEAARLASEEARVTAVTPTRTEPGKQYATPDETPPLAESPDYDPVPPPA